MKIVHCWHASDARSHDEQFPCSFQSCFRDWGTLCLGHLFHSITLTSHTHSHTRTHACTHPPTHPPTLRNPHPSIHSAHPIRTHISTDVRRHALSAARLPCGGRKGVPFPAKSGSAQPAAADGRHRAHGHHAQPPRRLRTQAPGGARVGLRPPWDPVVS